MRLITVLLIGATTIITIMGGCKKEDSKANNHMTHNGVEYQLDKGILESYGRWDDEGYGMDLVLLSPGFIIHEINGEIDSLSGIGHGIMFELFSNSSDKLDIGNYSWDENDDGIPFTMIYSDAVMNWNIQTGDGMELEADNGELKIISSEGGYELSFSLTMEDGNTLSGFYKGTLKYFDESYKNSSARKSFFN